MTLTTPPTRRRNFTVVGEPFTASLKTVSEDRVLVRADGLAAIVIDGATTKTGKLLDGHTEGWWAAETAMQTFARLNTDASVQTFVREVEKALAMLVHQHPGYSFHAVFTAYWAPRREIWWVGDCVALEISETGQIIDQHTSLIAPDNRTAMLRTEIIATLMKYDLPPGEVARLGREATLPWIKGQVQYANAHEPPAETVDWTYGVLAETPTPERFVGHVTLRPETTRLMLYSDGFPFPAARLGRLREKLMDLRHDNPHCIAQHAPYYPGTSKGFVDEATGELKDYYDDTTAVELQLV